MHVDLRAMGEQVGLDPPCYNINGCWNDSHMCAQALCREAIGMCCG